MPSFTFLFHAELNDFLPPSQAGLEIHVQFAGPQTVKHLFESLGVPHSEVGRIIAGQRPVDFSYLPGDGDHLSVHPARDIPAAPRFLLDNHLGKLATYLRMLGFDVLYRNDFQDDELAELLPATGRILLTRDRRLLMRKVVQAGYWVRSTDPEIQAREVVLRYQLASQIRPFHRCLRCNTRLCEISKEEILHRLQPLTRKYYREFHICPHCRRLYWKGSHYERMQALIERILASSGLDRQQVSE